MLEYWPDSNGKVENYETDFYYRNLMKQMEHAIQGIIERSIWALTISGNSKNLKLKLKRVKSDCILNERSNNNKYLNYNNIYTNTFVSDKKSKNTEIKKEDNKSISIFMPNKTDTKYESNFDFNLNNNFSEFCKNFDMIDIKSNKNKGSKVSNYSRRIRNYSLKMNTGKKNQNQKSNEIMLDT